MHRDTRVSRWWRRRLAPLATLIAALSLLAACGGSATPGSTILLATAAARLSADTGFHFLLKEDHGGTPTGANYDISTAEGDVVNPDKTASATCGKLKATATVDTAFGPVSGIQLIVVDDHAWQNTPLTGGQWQSADDYQKIGCFFTNANNGLAFILVSGLKDVSAPSDGSANGVPCWKINAKVSSDNLNALTGGQVQAGQQIPLTLCIGKDDGQLHEVIIPGQLTAYDTPQTTRTLLLSNFNESVTITPPPGA